MSDNDRNIITGQLGDPPSGRTSIRFGPAFLVSTEEKDHFALYRRLVTVVNDKGTVLRQETETPIGPLAVYRKWTKGDPRDAEGQPLVHLKTSHPETGEPMGLICVWRPDADDPDAVV